VGALSRVLRNYFELKRWCYVQDGIGQQIETMLVNHKKTQRVMKELHEKATGKHFATKIT
jgi:hypothetical protein